MFRFGERAAWMSALCGMALAACLPCERALAGHLDVLHAFKKSTHGLEPGTGMIEGPAGKLYGTTFYGGNDTCDTGGAGCGVVFAINADGHEKVVYAFTGGSDGYGPAGGLVRGGAGNIYGTAEVGGANGFGTVFKIASDGSETTLYAFKGGTDGSYPLGSLIMDSSGNLYGTTEEGGGPTNTCSTGCGTVYKVAPDGTESVLYAFSGMNGDGYNPVGGLALDSSGNLYGTTEFGGAGCSFGCGIFFRVSPAGTETILHTFGGFSSDDGSLPAADLMTDRKGTIYGTTRTGGNSNNCGMAGCGTIFSFTSGGSFNVVFAFQGGADGAQPAGGVVEDKSGNLYGSASEGGVVTNDCQAGCGTLYAVGAGGVGSTLYAFDGGKSGADPVGDLIMDASGNLYGTSTGGDVLTGGAAFRIKK